MATPLPLNCWRQKCLSRPFPSTRSFSTTSTKLALPNQIKKSGVTVKGQKKSPRIKNKAPQKPSGKPPMPGERKAMRKRIVLSNTNALEVDGLVDLSREMSGSLEKQVGKVVGLEGATVDGLRAVEAFKTTQGWGLFRRPSVLIREESVHLGKRMVDVEQGKETLKVVIDGAKGTGKSMLLLQAMATAFVRGWIVLNVPEAQEIVNAVNDYAAIPGTTPTLWSQPAYTANWLAQIAKANGPVLNTLKLSQKHNLPISVPADTTLTRLCELGARDSDVAWPLFQAFWSEITARGRPPILMAVDSLSYIMDLSQYRDPDFNLIHSHDLALVKHFTDYLSGAQTLPNGGAFLGATSRSHAPVSLSMNLAITQQVERQKGEQLTERDPYERKYDQRAESSLKAAEVFILKGLSKVEARGLMEYWAASGVLRQRVDERTVAEKWALAGNGIVGEIQRGALRMRI
ncbi:37S ribosomal protein, mitochondrial [Lachnellula willkommii]|uniref:Small ribosomal subunit protein mS29 n=1 Tax=Lachnellula willkommii TaxID=215461 RepID=A0A559M2R5_9HELO|nr:37S ribosomal protein, mitochondrial [Lachnellula willkommii]